MTIFSVFEFMILDNYIFLHVLLWFINVLLYLQFTSHLCMDITKKKKKYITAGTVNMFCVNIYSLVALSSLHVALTDSSFTHIAHQHSSWINDSPIN